MSWTAPAAAPNPVWAGTLLPSGAWAGILVASGAWTAQALSTLPLSIGGDFDPTAFDPAAFKTPLSGWGAQGAAGAISWSSEATAPTP